MYVRSSGKTRQHYLKPQAHNGGVKSLIDRWQIAMMFSLLHEKVVLDHSMALKLLYYIDW